MTLEPGKWAGDVDHVPGIRFASILVVLHLDQLAPATPRLPHRRFGALTQLAAAAALHVTLVVGVAVVTTAFPGPDLQRRHGPNPDQQEPAVPRLVFLAPELPPTGHGGGGGGGRQAGPIRRAQGVGSDTITLRVRKPRPIQVPETSAPSSADDASQLPLSVLDARPLASGILDQIGLPSVAMSGIATGPGSGGGVGTGSGTGIGSGRGSGVGAGTGGGIGGGIYRPGGAVSAPRLIDEAKPRYTSDALQSRIQGTVLLEAVVRSDGHASHIRVLRSLDQGLDEEAVAAVARWRFEPGRLAGEPVDVLVTIMVDFWIR
jgi:TonB family protein